MFCIICSYNVFFQISEHVPFTNVDTDKVKSTLKQIVRDWSVDGVDERRLCYDPIMHEIATHLPIPDKVIDICKIIYIIQQFFCSFNNVLTNTAFELGHVWG